MAFWDALSVDFEPIWSQISCSGTKICSKIDLRIINFGTWVLGRPPGGPQGVPKGRPTGPYLVFRGRFWGDFWCRNLLISESIFDLEKSELRERTFMDFGLVLGGPTLTMLCIYQQNQRFFIFELVGFRERFWHEKAIKMTSKSLQNLSKMRSKTRSEVEVVMTGGWGVTFWDLGRPPRDFWGPSGRGKGEG